MKRKDIASREKSQTYETTSIERSRCEIVFESESAEDGNDIREVLRNNGERENGGNSSWSGEDKQSENECHTSDNPDCVDGCSGELVHPVDPEREWKSTVSSESKSLA